MTNAAASFISVDQRDVGPAEQGFSGALMRRASLTPASTGRILGIGFFRQRSPVTARRTARDAVGQREDLVELADTSRIALPASAERRCAVENSIGADVDAAGRLGRPA